MGEGGGGGRGCLFGFIVIVVTVVLPFLFFIFFSFLTVSLFQRNSLDICDLINALLPLFFFSFLLLTL